MIGGDAEGSCWTKDEKREQTAPEEPPIAFNEQADLLA
jgi:hypothetical protein